jgi:regulator of cell morphogenesis and NO signaling
MNTILNKTLSEIVTENYQAAPVFEKFGLDFCCKGKRPLKTACEDKNIPAGVLVAELEVALLKENNSGDFNQMSLTELTEFIVRVHHGYVKNSMPQILSYVQRVASKHGDRFPYMVEVLDLFAQVQHEMTEHMLKEEKVLFPRIKLLEITGTTGQGLDFLLAPIDVMEEEHEVAGNTLFRIRELTNNYEVPQGACTTFQLTLASLQAFELDLHQHVHLENNVLFPKAITLFKTIEQVSA